MTEIISKKYNKNKSLIWLLAGSLLLLSVLFFTTNAFSFDSAKRFIVFNNDSWNLANEKEPNWRTNEATISFTVDLKEDYQKNIQADEEAAKKAAEELKAKQEAEAKKAAEELKAKQEAEANQDAPADSETTPPTEEEGDSSDSTEDKIEQPEQPVEQPTPVTDYAAERPFKIATSYNGKGVTPEIQPVGGDNFKGEYLVTVKLPADSPDAEFKANVVFTKGNEWKIPAQSNRFTIDRDATAPEVKLSTRVGTEYFTDGFFTKDTVYVSIEVDDKHFDEKQTDVSITKDELSLTPKIEWKEKKDGTGYTANLSFDQTGYYDIEVNGRDSFGNESKPVKTSFGIYNQGPTLTIENATENSHYREAVKLIVNGDLPIHEASAKIEKTVDGETTEEVKSFTREKAKKYALELEKDGDYKVTVTVKDSRNRDGLVLESTSFTIDKVAPEISVNGVKDKGEYKEAVEVALKATDLNLDKNSTRLWVTHEYKEKEDMKTYKGEEGFEKLNLSAEGDYTLEAKSMDRAGNISSKQLSFTIDSSVPVLVLSEVSGFYNKEVKIAATAEDRTLDLEKTNLQVTKDDEPYSEELKFKSIEDTKAALEHTFKEDGTYQLKLTATDRLGQQAKEIKRNFTLDQTAPVANISTIDDEAEYNTDQDVTISVSDLHLEQYQVEVKKNGEPYEIEPLKLEEDTAKIKHLFKEDGVYEITVTGQDKAKNQVALTKTFTIDTDAPDIQFSGIKIGKHTNAEKVDVTLSVHDFTFNKNKTTVEITRTNRDEVTELKPEKWTILKELKWRFGGQMDLSFKEEGDYQITVTSEDKFGVKNTATHEFTIDRTAPVVTMKGIAEGDFVQKGEVIVGVTEYYHDSNDVKVVVEKEGVAKEVPFESKEEHSKLELVFDKDGDFKEDGDYKITVAAEDEAGNKATVEKSTLTRTFTIDTIKPKIQILDAKTGSAVKNKDYDAENKVVSIVVDEHNFANNQVNIEVTATNTVTNERKKVSVGDWDVWNETSKLKMKFEEEFEYKISVTSKDKAKNEADAQTVIFTVDHTNPELEISGIEDGEHYKRKKATFRVDDTNIDLNKTNLKVLRNGQAYPVGKLTASGKTVGSRTFDFTEEGNYEVFLNSTDKAGRKTTHKPIAFIIDHTNPVVKVDGVEQDSFNPSSKKVTISVNEKNYATNDVELNVTKNGAPFNIGKFVTTKQAYSQLSHNFTQDGLYTISASSIDKAGNGPVSVKRTFTIDKTNPAIEITGVENGAYYNVDKPVQIAIRDVNLDVNKVTVTRNGARYNAGGFSVNGQLASFSHNFSGEGEYHIVVDATDQAGNSFSREVQFTIDKTDPVITPKFKGQSRVIKDGEYINEIFTPEFALGHQDDSIVSVTLNGKSVGKASPTASKEMDYEYQVLARDKAGNESTLKISFTLDTTSPKVSITGVIDGYFNENIAPVVTYSDVHLDRKKVSITLNGQPYRNNTKLDQEGDYVLKATVADLANNVTTRTIVFSIDKSKPVITFKEPISEKYFNSDLIPDLLIEDFSAYDVITMTLNGQDYQLGDPITSEGKHVLYFEVKDKAGNVQQLSVEFMIDKTPPKVVFDGVEKDGTYYEPVKVAIRLDSPTDKVKAVLINGELYDFNTTEDANGFTVYSTTLADFGSYEIEVIAEDDAGNESKTVLPFEIAEKSAIVKLYENKPVFAGSIIGVIAALGLAVALLVRRRKTATTEEE
ncbi:Ig-like domain-containing protein [Mesobacillus maritimus]|uniref:Ig-like domain-containing protein n=1 Tax=Mesobacillus maritimus TaxID=1643336 RepID=UPI00203E2ACE|nr:Ig-like domain-containing protein [Mesobacillus maritimus]MCM3668149.1 Ig-like domain-containing protein [Mesobacillus maritimus]